MKAHPVSKVQPNEEKLAFNLNLGFLSLRHYNMVSDDASDGWSDGRSGGGSDDGSEGLLVGLVVSAADDGSVVLWEARHGIDFHPLVRSS